MGREGFFMFGTAGGEILGQTKEGKICNQGGVEEMNGFGVLGINGDVMGPDGWLAREREKEIGRQ